MFRLAGNKEIRYLFEQYLNPPYEPFFVDDAGPELLMNFKEFKEYCRQDAELWVSVQDKIIKSFFLLIDIQPGLALANFDIGYFSGFPQEGSKEAAALAEALNKACRQNGITRLQMVALVDEKEKIAIAIALGFQQEGVLQEQFFYNGRYHNLIVLARLKNSRYAPQV
jgi:hypothetical protein